MVSIRYHYSQASLRDYIHSLHIQTQQQHTLKSHFIVHRMQHFQRLVV